MGRFYTVDRESKLQIGRTLTLDSYDVNGPSEFQEHFDSLFPDGVTHFGKAGLVEPIPVRDDQAIDLVFEYVRRAHYLDRPSRYQSIFGWETLEEAQAFQSDHQDDDFTKGKARIAVVVADQWFRADMRLTTLGNSALAFSLYAHLYWQGQAHPAVKPAWEILMRPPVEVVELVDNG